MNKYSYKIKFFLTSSCIISEKKAPTKRNGCQNAKRHFLKGRTLGNKPYRSSFESVDRLYLILLKNLEMYIECVPRYKQILFHNNFENKN